VNAGRVCALLGANGAGKTTLVRILTTLKRKDAGVVTLNGWDVDRDPARVRASIGLKAGTPEAATTAQLAIWPVAFLSTAFVDPRTMPSWLGVIAEWNPLSATASAAGELLSVGHTIGLTIAADHAVLFATVWPLILTAVFICLAIRAYRRPS
jgi:ABC-type branched-subunit amino acid transport system ATPase component